MMLIPIIGMFLIFSNSRDEREPHSFITSSPLFTNGFIKKWDIEELDMTLAAKDDEITKYVK